MKRTMLWVGLSWLLVLALLVASCAKKTEETAPAVKEAAPVVKEAAPVVKEAAPVVKEAAAAATEAPKYGGRLIVGRNSNILNWDESYIAYWTMYSNTGMVNEELLIGDWARGPAGTNEFDWGGASYTYRPIGSAGQLAESWEFPDDQTIIFHIRKGIHWVLNPNSPASRLVGGRELTADDIVFNFKRQFDDPKTTMYGVAGAARPLEIYATDKYTMVVKAPKGMLGMTWEYGGHDLRIMAPEVAKKYGDYQMWENSVGTGPFILTDYVPMSSATWVRQPNYYERDPVGPGKSNQLPYLDSIKQLIIPDMSTRMAALRTGKIDVDSFSYSVENAQSLRKSSPHLKYGRDLSGLPAMSMRLDKPGLPWGLQDDPNALKVRTALNLATNNQEVCDTLYGGEGERLSFYIARHKAYEGAYTPLDQLPESSRQLFEYHPDKAKQLLAEAGYPNGFKANIIVNSGDPIRLDMIQMLKAYWAKVGVDLSIQPVDNSIHQGLLLSHKHEQMYSHGQSSYNVNIMYLLKTGDMWNMSIVSDPKLDDCYLKMSAQYFNRTKLVSVMKEMNEYVIPRSYYTYLPTAYVYRFWQPWLKNYQGECGIDRAGGPAAELKYVWLDQDLRKSMAGR